MDLSKASIVIERLVRLDVSMVKVSLLAWTFLIIGVLSCCLSWSSLDGGREKGGDGNEVGP
jgi:hypothetical protein